MPHKHKGCGSKIGRPQGNTRKFNDMGVYFAYGIGCRIHDNCFTCPRIDGNCTFSNNAVEHTGDLKWMSNPGNGITQGINYV